MRANALATLVVAAGVMAGMSGCAVIAVADAAVTVGAVVVKTGAAVAGAAVDVAEAGVSAALPDKKENNR